MGRVDAETSQSVLTQLIRHIKSQRNDNDGKTQLLPVMFSFFALLLVQFSH